MPKVAHYLPTSAFTVAILLLVLITLTKMLNCFLRNCINNPRSQIINLAG